MQHVDKLSRRVYSRNIYRISYLDNVFSRSRRPRLFPRFLHRGQLHGNYSRPPTTRHVGRRRVFHPSRYFRASREYRYRVPDISSVSSGFAAQIPLFETRTRCVPRLLLSVAVKRARTRVPRRGGCTRVSSRRKIWDTPPLVSRFAHRFAGNVAGPRSSSPPRKTHPSARTGFRTTVSLSERNVGATAKSVRERTHHREADLADGHLCTCGQGPGNSGAICRSAAESIREEQERRLSRRSTFC